MVTELATCRLIVLFIICLLIGSGHSDGTVSSFQRYHHVNDDNSSYVTEKNADEAKIGGDTSGEYLVNYSDYMDVPNLGKYQSVHFDYLNIEPETNSSNRHILINKCCSRDYCFDVDRLICVKCHEGNSNKTEFFVKRIENYENGWNCLLNENIPTCGNGSVLSIRIVSRVGIDQLGIRIDGSVITNYCIDENPNEPNKTVVLTCQPPESYCKNRTCFRKCCPIGQSYTYTGRRCQKLNDPFEPDFYNLTTLTRDHSVRLSQFGIYLGDPCGSKGKYLLEEDLDEISYLGVDGMLYAPTYEKRFSENEFCVEHVGRDNKSSMGSFLCFSKTSPTFENSNLQFILLSLGLIISCMFLMATFLVYLFSPKSQNLYGKTLMCYIASLFAAYLCLAVVELKSKELNTTICKNIGYSLLFSFLAAFFWLNVMSFDIWKTFRVDRSVEKSKTDKRHVQFFWYSLYAWSFPCAITAICAYINEMPDFPLKSIKAMIGEDHCWFSKETKGIYVFFIAPISLVIALNIIFYVQTACKIWRVKSDVNKLEKQKKKKFSANKDQFIINGKLFIVMGITWSLEIISFFAPHPIWYITDTANALHGVFIFAIFVLKKKVVRQLSHQFGHPLKRFRPKQDANESEISKKNSQDLNTEAKTMTTRTSPTESEAKN